MQKLWSTGHRSDAEDFIKGVWLMLNQERGKEKDYVLSSDETHTIREVHTSRVRVSMSLKLSINLYA